MSLQHDRIAELAPEREDIARTDGRPLARRQRNRADLDMHDDRRLERDLGRSLVLAGFRTLHGDLLVEPQRAGAPYHDSVLFAPRRLDRSLAPGSHEQRCTLEAAREAPTGAGEKDGTGRQRVERLAGQDSNGTQNGELERQIAERRQTLGRGRIAPGERDRPLY